ncbi:non-ribosomal peptide synthetase [Brevibacillus halotolerans]|uniref:non-ribosomal peptide synthetase n=1 Tax=Brevibacillus halotolerans TaxID=1507437 RepID=UPI0015EF05F2|nr:amino acid adenylation domain-containing protein [Brevibacillus halotolerans]
MQKKDKIKDIYSLSPLQKGMLFHSMKDPQSDAYFEQVTLLLEGVVNPTYLAESIQGLVQKYDMFRSVFRYKKVDPVQVVLSERKIDLQIEDLTQINEEEQRKFIEEYRKKDRERGFDLSRDILLRFTLFQTAANRYELLWSHHHILMDGWCTGIVFQDLFQMYQRRLSGQALLPEVAPQYSEYIRWLKKQDDQQALAFWKEYLQGFENLTGIPRLRSGNHTYKQEEFIFSLGEEATQKLTQTAQKYQVTLNTVVQTIWGALLQKYNNTNDAAYGVVVSGRPAEVPNVEQMVGLFSNTIPIRIKKEAGKTFGEVLKNVQQTALEAEKYGYLSLADIQASAAYTHQLLDHILAFENFPMDQETFNQENVLGFAVKDAHTFEQTHYDLTVLVIPGKELIFKFMYNESVYSKEYLNLLELNMKKLVSLVIEQQDIFDPATEFVSDLEKDKLLTIFNRTDAKYPREKTIHELFQEQVDKNPDQVALVFGEAQLTYRELNEKANQMARGLRKQGVLPNQVIGLLTDRSLEMIIAILAIFKAGGAYMPIDPSYPSERIQYMLADSRTHLLLVQKAEMIPAKYQGEVLLLTEDSWMEENTDNLDLVNQAQDLAYVMYTSGSTGKPKGNLTTHQNIVKTIMNNGYMEITPNDRLLQLSNYAFDGSTFDIYSALLNGASLILVPTHVLMNPTNLASVIQDQHITVSFMTTSLFNTLVELDVTSLKHMRKVVFGGEKASIKHVEKALDYLGAGRLVNGYGPTETTVFATTYTVDHTIKETGIMPIGRPLNNTKVFILGADNHLQPIGALGELCVSGEGLARGYLNLPELTADRFVENPFMRGERMYRTGDLARWLPDGSIEYVGRIDEQVKIRGHRIELGEIEARLLEHPAISETVLLAKQDEQGHSFLCAYLVTNGAWSVAELRKHIKETLPDSMVPSYFIEIDKMPLTSNGKADKRALPEPDVQQVSSYIAPETETEEKLVQLFQEILSVEQVGTQDNFFELGGHSLKAMMLVSRMHKELDIEVPLKDVFARPSVKELAAFLTNTEVSDYIAIEPAAKQEFYPVSSAQRRMYVVEQIGSSNTTSYNMPFLLEIGGALDVVGLQKALKKLVIRHESLRTSFHMVDEVLMQKIHPDVEWDLMVMEAKDEDLPQIIDGFIQPFDLSYASLFRAGLVRMEADRHLLMLDMHHIISDGVSTNVLFQDLMQIYQGKELPSLRIQYKDYAVWQQAEAQVNRLREQEQYWLNQFSGELPVLEMPTDYTRPSIQQSEGDIWSFEISAEIINKVKKLSSSQGTTLYMTLLAAYQVLLSKYTGQEDVIVGSPIAGRPHADVEKIVGMFVNTLAFRGQPKSTQTFSAYLSEVKEQVLHAYDNAEYPFEELLEKLDLERDLSRHPLFDTMFALQNMEMAEINIMDLSFQPRDLTWKNAKFDLTWMMAEAENLYVTIEYSTSLFKPETIERLGKRFTHLLKQIGDAPERLIADLEVATEDEKHQILSVFNLTQSDYPVNKTVHQLFEEQVQNMPEQKAIVFGEEQVTYKELNAKANHLATLLKQKGITNEQLVAVMIEPSIEFFVGILAVLKAGGAYLPIDPTYPAERIAYILEDSQSKVLLVRGHEQVQTQFAGEILEIDSKQLSTEELKDVPMNNKVTDLAYVIYTSGSTGQPKGVMVEHRSLMNLSAWHVQYFGITKDDRSTKYAGVGFDASVWEVFPYLIAGATIYVIDQETRYDVEKLNQYVTDQGITISFLPTQFAEQFMLTDHTDHTTLRWLLIGGDKAQQAVQQKKYQIVNNYGPTENTVVTTSYIVSPEDKKIPIGRPIANNQVFILNKENQLQPVGIPGELCVSGDSLARGYLHRPELTSERFVANPFVPGERMYKTGDIARWLPDGNIEYLGRLDDQIKIRGYRVELGEIESAILEHEAIQETVVLARQDDQNQTYLCAYVVPKKSFDVAELRQYLGRKLPHFMIPAFFTEMTEFPITSNGKVDKKALPLPDLSKQSEIDYVAPTTTLEETLAELWTEVLGVSQVGIHDNFFKLGGDSIKAIQIAARLNTKQLKLEVKDLFQAQTIAQVIPYIKTKDSKAEQGIVQGKVELTPIQEWFFQQSFDIPHHWNQSMMFYRKEGWDQHVVQRVFQKIAEHHDALRMAYQQENGKTIQINRGVEGKLFELSIFDFRQQANVPELIEQAANRLQSAMNLQDGPLVQLGLFQTSEGDHLLIAIHHLVVDAVSWRIITEDFMNGYQQDLQGEPIAFTSKTDSYQKWAKSLLEYATSEEIQSELKYWQSMIAKELPALPRDSKVGASYLLKDVQEVAIQLTKEQTNKLLTDAHNAYNTQINDLLLTALALTIQEWAQTNSIAITLEGHGREDIGVDIDINRTVGWFTSMYPVVFDLQKQGIANAVKQVKEELRQIPNKGIGYGVVRYLSNQGSTELDLSSHAINPEISFNYLGQMDQSGQEEEYQLSPLSSGQQISQMNQGLFPINVSGIVVGNQLSIQISYDSQAYHDSTMEKLIQRYQYHLLEIINHCVQQTETELTPSDFSTKELSMEDLESVFELLDE